MSRVLIVEDEALIAMMCEDWLEQMGHTTVGPAFTLADALTLAETDFDVAIIDLGLGRDSTYLVADRLTARGIPYVFATGRSGHEVDQEHKATSVLAKPYQFDEFRRTVTTLLAATPMGQARKLDA